MKGRVRNEGREGRREITGRTMKKMEGRWWQMVEGGGRRWQIVIAWWQTAAVRWKAAARWWQRGDTNGNVLDMCAQMALRGSNR